MSSRAAAGRKRLRQEPVPNSPKPLSRGFFSRSKSAAPAPTKDKYPSPPPVPTKYQGAPEPPLSPPPKSNLASEFRLSRSETPRDIQPLSSAQKQNGLFKSASAKAYPSPGDSYRPLPSKQPVPLEPPAAYGPNQDGVKKAASTSDMMAHSRGSLAEHFPTPPAHVFLESTYQPPPPVHATHSSGSRPLPTNPLTGQTTNPPFFPPEKGSPSLRPGPYPSPLPSSRPTSARPRPIYSAPSPPLSEIYIGSPLSRHSPLATSLLLQPNAPSPTPTELPRYTSPSPSNHALSRPPLQVATLNLSVNSSLRPQVAYQNPQRMEDNGMYPSPPGSDSRHIPLPYQSHGSALNTPMQASSADHGRWYQQYPSSARTRNLVSPSFSTDANYNPSFRGQTAESIISSSSDSSQRSYASYGSSNPGSSPTPFVFPGSRSIARPKVSPTTGAPRIKLRGKRNKSRGDKHRDPGDSPISPTSTSPTSTFPPQTPLTPQSHHPHATTPALWSPPLSDSQSSSGSSGIVPEDSNQSTMPPPDDDVLRTRKLSYMTTNTSSTSSSGKSPSGFVYPGGRSRAHPNTPPINLSSFKLKSRSKHSRKLSNSSGSPATPTQQRTRFMGIPLKKKKTPSSRAETPPSPLAFTLGSSAYTVSEFGGDYSGSQAESTQSGSSRSDSIEFKEKMMSPEVRMQERVKRIKSRIGSYPLDPYDSILLDNDRHTGDLLNRLNDGGAPSFYDYGTNPPATVLDLGCGQGHWVVDAAIAWKGHGTKVTGYDMVDISKVLLPWAIKQGVVENIRFVRGNFLKQRLPFNNNSFDLVRMSSLTLCITSDAWVFVFQEVCRVLTIGGRLELIDDSIIFPYGKATFTTVGAITAPSTPRLNMFAPRLDINIPSSAFSTFCIYDNSENPNPGLGFPEEDDIEEEDDLLDLYEVKEEGESDLDDTATLSGHEPQARRTPSPSPPPRRRDPRATPVPRNRSQTTQSSTRLRLWNTHAATSRDLEALFEHMLTHKFGMHMRPDEFVLDLMQEVFGHAREVRTMHLSLAPSDTVVDEDAPRGRSDTYDGPTSTQSPDQYGSYRGAFRRAPSPSPARTISQRTLGTPLSQSPGLILSPSTFIPMAQSELEIHASKHLRLLLSCKKFLVEHAMEATEDEEIDEDSVLEALWEFEGFLRARFNQPPGLGHRDKSPSLSDTASTRGSIMSVSSDAQDAMWEYQSELRQRFAWPLDGADSPTATRSQITPKASNPQSPVGQNSEPAVPPTSLIGNRTSSPSPSAAPPYSRSEMTHVRTFRVYEAIKIDDSILGTAI